MLRSAKGGPIGGSWLSPGFTSIVRILEHRQDPPAQYLTLHLRTIRLETPTILLLLADCSIWCREQNVN